MDAGADLEVENRHRLADGPRRRAAATACAGESKRAKKPSPVVVTSVPLQRDTEAFGVPGGVRDVGEQHRRQHAARFLSLPADATGRVDACNGAGHQRHEAAVGVTDLPVDNEEVGCDLGGGRFRSGPLGRTNPARRHLRRATTLLDRYVARLRGSAAQVILADARNALLTKAVSITTQVATLRARLACPPD